MLDPTNSNLSIYDDHVDDHVDNEIKECLLSNPPKSFFMFAGAGSGKTRSLIKILEVLATEKGTYFAERGKQVAVITYTNAACDEISRRLQYNPIFHISTIHSFLWELIGRFQSDIKEWLKLTIQNEINDLKIKQNKSRVSKDYTVDITKKEQRLNKINVVQCFSYNPNGDNFGSDSLSHNEVINIGVEFISSEATMQQIIINKYPIILIDECQDTNKKLIDALLKVYASYKDRWAIGMFGDTMQKIYMEGKVLLDQAVPHEWVFPTKVMNHRSSKRIVSLANSIRAFVDTKSQQPRSDAQEGLVRLFILSTKNSAKEAIEEDIAKKMASLTNDSNWNIRDGYKCLILEHKMAASRLGFIHLYTSLNSCNHFRTELLQGGVAELSFLSNIISPLVKAFKEDDAFEVARLIHETSHLVNKDNFASNRNMQQKLLEQADNAVSSLFSLWKDGNIPSCIDVLKNIQASGLYELSDRVNNILDESYSGNDEKVYALKEALSVPFDEMEKYAAYVSDKTRFATHQGVKGLEFPRVMVILDDSQAKGSQFSYEKLFGAKAKTATDLKNETEGKETTIERTARLFYVACTRAINSLAVVAYSENPEMAKATAIKNQWFLPEEIVVSN